MISLSATITIIYCCSREENSNCDLHNSLRQNFRSLNYTLLLLPNCATLQCQSPTPSSAYSNYLIRTKVEDFYLHRLFRMFRHLSLTYLFASQKVNANEENISDKQWQCMRNALQEINYNMVSIGLHCIRWLSIRRSPSRRK